MPKLLFARPPLDAVEERKVRKLAGARHAPADWIRRAQIIAMSWDGARVPAIAQALGCSPKAVRHRLVRFAADGLDGLGDRPGAGRTPRISQAQRSQLIALVASPPPGRGVRDDTGELGATDATGPAVDPGRTDRRGPRGRYRHRPLPGAPDPARRGRALAPPPLLGGHRRSGVRPNRTRVVDYYTHPPADTTVIAADELAPGDAAHRRPASGLERGRPPAQGTVDRPPRTGQDLGLRRPADRRRAGGDLLRAVAQQRLLAGVPRPAGAGESDRDDRGDHRQPVQPLQPGHPGLAGRASADRGGVHPHGRLLAEPAGGLVADLPPARPGRADLRRSGRDHLGHRAGHRPAQQPCQTLGLGTATATATTPPTALYLPALRNEALVLQPHLSRLAAAWLRG